MISSRQSATLVSSAQIQTSALVSLPQKFQTMTTNTCVSDIHNPTALTKYLELTLQLARIILSVVLSMGPQNDGTVTQARRFLHEYRPAIVGIFKRNAHIGSVAPGNEGLLEELVDCFTVLIEVVGFLEVKDSSLLDSNPCLVFSAFLLLKFTNPSLQTDEGRTTTQKAARLYT